ncbi:hypothetical protein LPB140_03105 [Sphingorhabdus lutea]|uniref:Secreted protein n=1 Tax=Sphingorhabdus lutea TaxID=1913578 RepID=A0A1L3JA13_9SPHN|nr:hypothetical protein [Sphingorhabdus lutea]APG61975.1 hypothetical protein LPB140_03105 [Sphingorhabdus lutea]
MNNPKLRGLIFATAAAATLAGCGADDIASPGEGNLVVLPPVAVTPTPTPTPTTPTGPAADCPTNTANVGTIVTGGGQTLRNCQISGTLTGNVVLNKRTGTIYSISGKVEVGQDRGADAAAPIAGRASGILTIDPGVTIFGATNADFLLVNRGSQLFVDGSASAPVVMTSRANVVGTSTADSIGQWGGLVILGRAPIGDCADAGAVGGTVNCQAPVEGTAGSIYGGATPTDSSGSIRYLSLRYSGFQVDTNNELNGITLGGVGSGTIFEYVQVHNSSDDGIEWFGGRVNGKNLVLTGNDDDSLDVDSGYKGNLQFVIVTQRSGGGDKLIEGDSTDKPVDAVPRTNFQISNFTFVTPRSASPVHLRGGMDGTLVNGIVSGNECLDIDTSATSQAADSTKDELGPIRFRSVKFVCTTAFTDDADGAAASAFNAGTNNSANGTSTLTGVFINGASETAITPFNASTLSSFFVNTSYIGAVRDASDTWWQNWACGLSTSNSPSCTSIPSA